jgi:hypothetical protein
LSPAWDKSETPSEKQTKNKMTEVAGKHEALRSIPNTTTKKKKKKE